MNHQYEERIDDLHINDFKIIQNPKNFCFGMDAVLLSDFTKVKEGETVLDLGTGTGIIPILLQAKTKGKHFTGLEIQEASVDMAKRSVAMNKQGTHIEIIQGDIKEADTNFPLSSFEVITSNPPYMDGGKGLVNEHSPKAIARHEIFCTLEDVIRVASRLACVGGRFYMIHKPHRLIEIVQLLKKYKMEPKRIRFVHAYQDREANMLLIEAIRNGKPMVKVEKPLIIYKDINRYTDEIYEIYGYERSEDLERLGKN
ncbi:MAG: SAM-dependent methyltransferase [Firmicutes bacterium HGW-Firmicutes-7]|nr:MAG: SAM-dependent methyltransferase [Firmicutes bacterium HGW-Firmicutes-7]